MHVSVCVLYWSTCNHYQWRASHSSTLITEWRHCVLWFHWTLTVLRPQCRPPAATSLSLFLTIKTNTCMSVHLLSRLLLPFSTLFQAAIELLEKFQNFQTRQILLSFRHNYLNNKQLSCGKCRHHSCLTISNYETWRAVGHLSSFSHSNCESI